MVVFDEESEIFASDLYPRVRFGLVAQYHAKGGQQYLPKADDMSDDPEDADDVRQLWQIMPIPTHWVPIFMDGPSMDVAIGRLTVLVKQAKQEELDDYAPFIYMLTTASCTKEEDTNGSIMAIEATKLDYRIQVRATAEKLWNRIKSTSNLKKKQSTNAAPRKEGNATVTDNSPSSDEEESSKGSDDAPVGRAKSQQPNAVTPPPRTTDRWQQQTSQLCAAMVQMNAANMKSLIKAMTATNAAVVATGSPLSKLSVTRRTVLEACAGHDDGEDEFELPQVYNDLEAAGWTTD
jgi:hypothetical protein